MTEKPVFILRWQHLVAMLIGLLFWAMILSPAWAGDDRRGGDDVDIDINGGDVITNLGDTNVEGSTLTGGDVTLEGSRAFAFSHALGDVDINDCLASTAWGSIIVSRQTVGPNLWCMAEVYDAKGMKLMAAKMRCDIDVIAEHFTTRDECLEANTAPDLLRAPQPAAVAAPRFDENDEREERHEFEIATALARTEALEKRLDDEAAARRAGARRAEEQRQAERRNEFEYAQQKMAEYAQIVAPEPQGNE